MNKEALFFKCVSFISSVHSVTHELTKDVRPDFVTQVQYSILEYIAVNKSATPSEISDCQHMSMPNTSRELRKLSEKGLIEKTHDTEDKRKQYIRLSQTGEAMMKEAFAAVQARFLERIQQASETDLAEADRALAILQETLFYSKQEKS